MILSCSPLAFTLAMGLPHGGKAAGCFLLIEVITRVRLQLAAIRFDLHDKRAADAAAGVYGGFYLSQRRPARVVYRAQFLWRPITNHIRQPLIILLEVELGDWRR